MESDKIIEAITKEINELKKEFRYALYMKSAQIKCLKDEVTILKARLTKVEKKMGENETQVRMNNVILSNPDIPVPTITDNCIEVFRKFALDELKPVPTITDNCIEVFRKFALDNLKLVIPTADITSAIGVGKPKSENNSHRTSAILVKLNNLEVKNTLMINGAFRLVVQ